MCTGEFTASLDLESRLKRASLMVYVHQEPILEDIKFRIKLPRV